MLQLYQSVLDVYCAVGDRSEVLVVGDDYESLAELVAQVEEELVQLCLVLRVERARRLVGEHHSRIVHQRARHSHTLLLAAREFVGLVVGAVGETHESSSSRARFFASDVPLPPM